MIEWTDEKILAVEVAAEAYAPAYEKMGWEWVGEGVPDVDRIRERIVELIDSLYDYWESSGEEGGAYNVSSGRLNIGFVVVDDDDNHTENHDFTISLEGVASDLERMELIDGITE